MNRLSKAGYQVISIPDSELIPWTIIDGDFEQFKVWGPIWKFSKDVVRPEMKENIIAPKILQQACDDVINANAGFSILKFLGLKDNTFSAEYANANKMQIVYLSVLKDAIDLIDICRYIKKNIPDKDIFKEEALEAMKEGGEAAIIFETLKSNQIAFVAYNESGVEIKAGIEEDVATAKGGIRSSKTDANTLYYSGEQPLIFAYKALPFWVHKKNGKYEFNFKVKETPNFGACMGKGDSEMFQTITPTYVNSLEEKGLLQEQCTTVLEPHYKIYSPNTMIKRVQ